MINFHNVATVVAGNSGHQSPMTLQRELSEVMNKCEKVVVMRICGYYVCIEVKFQLGEDSELGAETSCWLCWLSGDHMVVSSC